MLEEKTETETDRNMIQEGEQGIKIQQKVHHKPTKSVLTFVAYIS